METPLGFQPRSEEEFYPAKVGKKATGKQKNGKYTTHGSFGCYQLPIYNAIYTGCNGCNSI